LIPALRKHPGRAASLKARSVPTGNVPTLTMDSCGNSASWPEKSLQERKCNLALFFHNEKNGERKCNPRPVAPGAIKTVGQLTAPLCPGGASENSPAFQRRVSEPKESSVPEGWLRATRILSRPFGTRFSVLASPALKRRAYCQMSLRDKTPATHSRRFQPHPVAPPRLTTALAGPNIPRRGLRIFR